METVNTTWSGYLSTSGSNLVDQDGNVVQIQGVNWFGMPGQNLVPNGLWARNYQDMIDEMKDAGFNTIRIPFSGAIFDPDAVVSGVNEWRNPDMYGKSPLEALDLIVDYAGQIGMKIILDYHRLDIGAGNEKGGLWYDADHPESEWIDNWVALAERYAGDSTVIGADLFNEPHGDAHWGSIGGEAGDATDWVAAAERAANAIGEVNPDLLILVEGLGKVNSWYWVGGNLQGVATDPVEIEQADKLVYSPHDYPWSISLGKNAGFLQDQTVEKMLQVFHDHWGYIAEQGIAPVLVGEFGSAHEEVEDEPWSEAIVQYLSEHGINWTYFAWNPNTNTGGILNDDWRTIDPLTYSMVAEIMEKTALQAAGTPQEADDSSIVADTENLTLYGDVTNDTLNGGVGDDYINGGDGNDVLNGHDGNDMLVGAAGDDVMTGGAGVDTFVVLAGDGDDSITDFTPGEDLILFGADVLSDKSVALSTAVDIVDALDGSPMVTYTYAGGDLNIAFSDGGSLSLQGFGFGLDAALLERLEQVPVEPEATLLSSDPIEATRQLTERQLSGSDESDHLFAGGQSTKSAEIQAGTGDDKAFGSAANDAIYGGDGDDKLYGKKGNDVIFGEAGDDRIYGEAGDDILSGGVGNDRLFGGQGADSFLFMEGDGKDAINDFTSGVDSITFGAGTLYENEVVLDTAASIGKALTETGVENWFTGSTLHIKFSETDQLTLWHVADQFTTPVSDVVV